MDLIEPLIGFLVLILGTLFGGKLLNAHRDRKELLESLERREALKRSAAAAGAEAARRLKARVAEAKAEKERAVSQAEDDPVSALNEKLNDLRRRRR